MVATPSKKKSKFTYADRVVSALSDIQRQHKKHSVHLATLRAQVRRNAETRKDPLGPQWSNWVSRAVAKLEEQGVLEQSDPGHVSFTAEAKKTLVAARRQTLTALPGTPSRTAPDLYIAKSVTQSRGSTVKRRRRSSVGVHRYVDTEDDSESEMHPYVSIRSRRNSLSSKRARRPSISGVSRLTKAELIERVAAMEEDETDANDKIARLERELQNTRTLLQKTQQHQQPNFHSGTHDYDRDPTPLTLVLDSDNASRCSSPSPVRPLVNAPITSLCARDIIRTESGSVIDRYSKQVTPAPSTSDHEGEIGTGNNPVVGPFGSDGRPPDDTNGPATPLSIESPVIPPVVLSAAVLGGEDRDTQIPIEPLDTRLVELGLLRAERDELVSKYAALATSMTAHKDWVKSLQDSDQQKAVVIAMQREELDTARTQISELRARLGLLESSFRDQASALQTARQESQAKSGLISNMENALTDRAVELTVHQQALTDAQDALKTMTVQATNHDAEMQGKLSNIREATATTEAQAKEFQDRVDSLNDLILCLKSNISTHEVELALTRSQTQGLLTERARAVMSAKIVQNHIHAMQNSLSALSRQPDAPGFKNKQHDALEAAKLGLSLYLATERTDQEDPTDLKMSEEEPNLADTIVDLDGDIRGAFSLLLELISQCLENEVTIVIVQDARDTAIQVACALTAQTKQLNKRVTDLGHLLNEAAIAKNDQASTIMQLSGELETERSRCSAQATELSNGLSIQTTLQSVIDAKTSEICTLQSQLAHAEATRTSLQSNLRMLQEEKTYLVNNYEKTVSGLQMRLSESEGQATVTQTELQSVQTSLREHEAALQRIRRTLAEARDALGAEQSRVSSLEREVEDAASAALRNESYCNKLRESKLHDEKQIRSLRESFAQLSELQRRCLAEFEEKVASIQPSASVVHSSTTGIGP